MGDSLGILLSVEKMGIIVNMDVVSTWKTTLAELEMSISPVYFPTWIKPLNLMSLEEEKEGILATILCPSSYHQTMLVKRWAEPVKRALGRVVDKPVELAYVVGKETKERMREAPLFEPPEEKEQKGGGSHNLNPRLTFDTYVVGSSNNFAYAAAQGAAKSPGTRYNPLFIYGGVGLGKTHLMHAVGHAVFKEHPDWNIMYISAETFGNDLIASLQNKKTAQFKKKYRAPNVLLVDDVQFIAGKEYIQEEFFHTFNELYMSQRQVILTSDKPPQEIARLEERLISRFMGGLMVDVQAPDFETRVAILTQKCQALGVEVTADVIGLLAEKAVGNIRELEGALQALLAKATSEQRSVDGELIREHFGAQSERRGHRVRPNELITKVAQYYSYKVGELTGASRKAPLIAARHTAMYLLYHDLGIPYVQIGNLFGGRDHTTVMHAVEKIEGELKANPELSQTMTDIKHGI